MKSFSHIGKKKPFCHYFQVINMVNSQTSLQCFTFKLAFLLFAALKKKGMHFNTSLSSSLLQPVFQTADPDWDGLSSVPGNTGWQLHGSGPVQRRQPSVWGEKWQMLQFVTHSMRQEEKGAACVERKQVRSWPAVSWFSYEEGCDSKDSKGRIINLWCLTGRGPEEPRASKVALAV